MKIAFLTAATAALCFANSLTIYNNNLAYIQKKQTFLLQKGEQTLNISGLPKSVIADSILAEFQDGVEVLSKSYYSSPLTVSKLLQENVGKEVSFYTKEKTKKLDGKLVSISPALVQSSNGYYYIVNPSQIIYKSMPKNISQNPSLLLDVVASKKHKSTVILRYLAGSINWSSSYIATIGNNKLTLKAWADIANNSGKDFKQADVTLISGEPNRVSPPVRRLYKSRTLASVDAVSANMVMPREISGYHSYKIPFKVAIKSGEPKQIPFIVAKDISFKRFGVVRNRSFHNYGVQKLKFTQVIVFENSKANNLGVPLPGGVVRIYDKDTYLGEDRLPNTPKKERVTLKIGTLFDVAGTKRITKYRIKGKYIDLETTYSLNNRANTPVVLKIDEEIPRYKKRINFTTSCSGICTQRETSALGREFTIKLQANQSYSFTTELETTK